MSRKDNIHPIAFRCLYQEDQVGVPLTLILEGHLGNIGIYAGMKALGQGGVRCVYDDLCDLFGTTWRRVVDAVNTLRAAGWCEEIQRGSHVRHRNAPGVLRLFWLASTKNQKPPQAILDTFLASYRAPQFIQSKAEWTDPLNPNVKKGRPAKVEVFDPLSKLPSLEQLRARQAAYYPIFDPRHPESRYLDAPTRNKAQAQWEDEHGMPYTPLPDYDLLGFVTNRRRLRLPNQSFFRTKAL